MGCCIAVKELVAGYGGKPFVRGVSFEVRPGELLALIGPNGSGKTTVLRVLAGLLPIMEGSVEVCGRRYLAGQRIRASRIISYAPAVPQADPWARVEEVLLASRYGVSRSLLLDSKEDRRAVHRAAELLGITGLLNKFFGELSSGEKKLATLAAAIARETPVLLVDEPIAFLDVSNQWRALEALQRLARAKRTSVVIAGHELHLLPIYVDKVLLLSRGREVVYGPPNEVLDRRILEEVYGARLSEVKVSGRRVYIPIGG